MREIAGPAQVKHLSGPAWFAKLAQLLLRGLMREYASPVQVTNLIGQVLFAGLAQVTNLSEPVGFAKLALLEVWLGMGNGVLGVAEFERLAECIQTEVGL